MWELHFRSILCQLLLSSPVWYGPLVRFEPAIVGIIIFMVRLVSEAFGLYMRLLWRFMSTILKWLCSAVVSAWCISLLKTYYMRREITTLQGPHSVYAITLFSFKQMIRALLGASWRLTVNSRCSHRPAWDQNSFLSHICMQEESNNVVRGSRISASTLVDCSL